MNGLLPSRENVRNFEKLENWRPSHQSQDLHQQLSPWLLVPPVPSLLSLRSQRQTSTSPSSSAMPATHLPPVSHPLGSRSQNPWSVPHSRIPSTKSDLATLLAPGCSSLLPPLPFISFLMPSLPHQLIVRLMATSAPLASWMPQTLPCSPLEGCHPAQLSPISACPR